MTFILIRAALVVILIIILVRLFKRFFNASKRRYRSPGAPGENHIEEMKKDPVCGVFVPASQALSLRMGDETVYFCSEACRDRFLRQNRDKK